MRRCLNEPMKIQIQFKDPDGFYDCVRDAVKSSLSELKGLDPDERESLIEERHNKVAEKCRQWIKYGEYVAIEIDTDSGTATVLPAQ